MKYTFVSSEPSTTQTYPVQVLVTNNPSPIEPPSAWMQQYSSPTEIMLATVVVIGAIAKHKK